MAYPRDVQAFHDRASSCNSGWRGSMHLDIVARTVVVALDATPTPRRVLDVGCGTGSLLRTLADRLVDSGEELVGIDAARGMIDMARMLTEDSRIVFSIDMAEQLPYSDSFFNLVVSTTSFDHWRNQAAGLRECARVLSDDGHMVLTDQFSLWLLPTVVCGRRGHARTKRRASALLQAAGFRTVSWHPVYQSSSRRPLPPSSYSSSLVYDMSP